MVEIRNIRLINSIIYADCYAEGKESGYFTIEVNIKTEKVVYFSRDDYDSYVNHAKRHLLSFIKENKPFPEVTGTMWV